MRFRPLVLAALALAVLAAPARADVVTESAIITYCPSCGLGKWDFVTGSFVSGHIGITSKSVGKRLMKLKETGSIHNCFITYDTDSKIAAGNGDFYSVFKIGKCA